MKKTKIVCTIGPACSREGTIRAMVEAGMNVARLNFSHGTHAMHAEVFHLLRRISAEMDAPLAILQDLCGPKIRVGEIPGEGIPIRAGDRIRLTGAPAPCSPEILSISYPQLADDLKPGEPVLIEDGLMRLCVEKVQGSEVLCQVQVGGLVKSHKGVNFPDSRLHVSAMTEKDREDALFGLKLGVDFIALSFVRRPEDLAELRQLLAAERRAVPVLAKIEMRDAIEHLEAILTAADGAMVARGDLGVESPLEQVPLVQKEIIRICNRMSKPVITATQMLDSMIRNPTPTRAEVSDVANAILDGTDAVMLSGETATGQYPVEAVSMMSRICRAAEVLLHSRPSPEYSFPRNVVNSISEATCRMSAELGAGGIVVLTDSGRTARLMSRYKPKAPILAVTRTAEARRRLALSWGVFPLLAGPEEADDFLTAGVTPLALRSGLVSTGDLVVITAGLPVSAKGSTNAIQVEVLGHVFLRGHGVGPAVRRTGRVFLAEGTGQALGRLEEGDVLVLKRLEAPLLSSETRPAALVTEEGGEGSFAESYCRRLEIPGILNVPDATRTLIHGGQIGLDSGRGILYRIEE